jgi:hypothetical protein
MAQMKFYITIEDIRNHNPCYDPAEKLGEGWAGNLIEILDKPNISANDKLWAVSLFLDDKTNRLFAVWCAREALKLIKDPDPRSIAACDVAEKFALGSATKEELAAAWAAAWAAAGDAARVAAWDAARDAAGDAARAAAWDAACAAARAAAWAAAGDAAGDAAWAAAWAAQITRLRSLILEVIQEGEGKCEIPKEAAL